MTLALLKNLRDETGLSLADCKAALAAGGDLAGARQWLSTQGLLKTKPFSLSEVMRTDDDVALTRWLEAGGVLTEATPLVMACGYNAVKVARVLLQHGASARDAFRKQPWSATQCAMLEVVAPTAPAPLLQIALTLSLTHSALARGTGAVVYLNTCLGPERMAHPLREVVLRAVECGCTELAVHWESPCAVFDGALTEEESARYEAVLGWASRNVRRRPTTVRALAAMSLAAERQSLERMRKDDASNGRNPSDPSDATRVIEVAVARLEGMETWLATLPKNT